MSRHGCDVAIAGGGLAGATLAAALRRWPLSVTVIDPGRGGGGGGGGDARSLALSYGSARLYRALGHWEEIGREAAPIREVHVSRRGRFGFTRIRAGECGVEALGYVIPARSLERRLNEALDADSDSGSGSGSGADSDSDPDSGTDSDSDSGTDSSGTGAGAGSGAGRASFRRIRAAVETVEVHGRGVFVAARGPDGPISVAARLVVGADGAESAVRRAAGLPLRVHRCDHVAFAGDFTPERPHRGRAFERFTERGPLAVLPLGEERCGFVWAVPESVAAAEGFDGPGLGARLAEMFGSRLGELRRRRAAGAPPPPGLPRAPRHRPPNGARRKRGERPAPDRSPRLQSRVARRGGVGAVARGGEHGRSRPRFGARAVRGAARADHTMARLLTGSLLRVYGARVPPVPALGAAGLFALDRLGPVKRGFAKLTMGDGWVHGRGEGEGEGEDTGLRRALRGALRHGGWREEAGGAARAD